MSIDELKDWDLVIIGASNLWNVAEPYAGLIEQDRGVKVVVHDETQGDLTAHAIAMALQGKSGGSFKREKWPQLVRDAEVLVISFGGPEASLSEEQNKILSDCMMSPTPGQACCTSLSIAPWKADWDAIWEEIAILREGRPLIVRAVELYNPHLKLWPDGEIEAAGRACWNTLNAAFRQSAEAHGVLVLSGYDWLNGPNHDRDLHAMGLMVDDLHLNEAGVKLLVELLRQSGYDYGKVKP